MKIKLLLPAILIFAIYGFFSCAKENDSQASANSAPTASKGETKFYSFNEGIKKAAAEGKPLLIDFYADWCRYCVVMDKEVFTDGEVADLLNGKFITVRIRTDRPDREQILFRNVKLTSQEFAQYLGVEGLPTVVFMDKNANPITRIPGFINREVFLPLLKFIHEGCYQKKVSFREYMDGKARCQ